MTDPKLRELYQALKNQTRQSFGGEKRRPKDGRQFIFVVCDNWNQFERWADKSGIEFRDRWCKRILPDRPTWMSYDFNTVEVVVLGEANSDQRDMIYYAEQLGALITSEPG